MPQPSEVYDVAETKPSQEIPDAGLPMSPKWDPEKLAAEKEQLTLLASAPLGKKIGGYVRRTGPGLLQSAMTLGAGSATASVLAGASFGYKLLWVQPVAMFLGVMMFAAMSNIVLTTQERPYKSFGRQVGGFLVLLWALGTVFASVIWHFPQYTLLAGAGRDIASMVQVSVEEGGEVPAWAAQSPDGQYRLKVDNGGEIPAWVAKANDALPWGIKINDKITNLGYLISFGVGAAFLAMNILMVFSYGKGVKGVKIYERFLRTMIMLVILFFLLVVVLNFNRIEWLELFRGFTGYYGLPKNAEGVVESATYLQVLGMLGAAVGINMTFLYPYSLLAKGWGKEHKTLAKWDLVMTMFIPFSIVTSLIIMAMTVTGVYDGGDAVRQGLAPLDAANSFNGIPGGKIIFCLGLMGMCGGAISAHMVACGFTMCEMFKLKMTHNRFRLFALTPAIGVLGVVVPLPMWFPVIASAICCILLPIAYLIIIILNNKRGFIGEAVGHGFKRLLNNLILLAALCAVTFGAGLSVRNLYLKFFADPPAASAPAAAPTTETPADAPANAQTDTKSADAPAAEK